MHIVDMISNKTCAIWEAHKAARKDGQHREEVLLSALRTPPFIVTVDLYLIRDS